MILTVDRPAARSWRRTDVTPDHKGVDSTAPTLHSADSICIKLRRGNRKHDEQKGRRKQVTQVPLVYLLPQVVIRVELLV